MTSLTCPRLSEAEALRDGRLGATERSSFERHVSGCAACGRELEALEALAEPLREATYATDELHARRERTRLLSAFAGSLAAPAPQVSRRPLRLWAAAGAALACGSLALGLWLGRPPAPVPSAVVHADSTAVWSTRTVGAREEIVLSDGALLIHVDHQLAGQPRLRVVLPDGDLEDIGTIFSVSVQDQRTARVAVHEGSVVLRIRGRPEQTIAAGNTWTPLVAAPAPAIVPAPPSPPPPSASSAKPIERPRISRKSSSPPPASPAAAASDPARDFRAATAAFRRGESREAATAFTRFLAQHAADPRAEDAAYLRVLALQRCGMREETRSAARQYLERYPDGLRRAEVARLAVLPDEPAGQ